MAFGNFTVDMSQLSSNSLTHDYEAEYYLRDNVAYPLDYTAQFVYTDCNKNKIAGSSYHQVLRITTDQWSGSSPTYGSEFRLSFGDYFSTDNLGYDVTSSTFRPP